MGLMRNIMMPQPRMPSTQVCQVKYRNVGLPGGREAACPYGQLGLEPQLSSLVRPRCPAG